MTQLIITPQELAKFRLLSTKLDTPKINECIKLAQLSDFHELLGDFFFDVVDNIDTESYQDLFNGSRFECEKATFVHLGLKAVLADLAYSRYLYLDGVNVSPFGLVAKDSPNSTAVDTTRVKALSKQAQEDAGVKFKMVKKYIEANEAIFPRFAKHTTNEGVGFNSFRGTIL